MAERFAVAVLHGLWAGDAPRREMLHQRQEERNVADRHALLVEREDVVALPGVNQEVRVFDAFGDALIGQQLAKLVAGEEFREVFRCDVGVDGHLPTTALRWPLSSRAETTAPTGGF